MPDRRIALRSFLSLALLALLLPIVLASGSLFYRSALAAMEAFAMQLAQELSERVREKLASFFAVPQRVVAFNVEQLRAGHLPHRQPDALMRQFLLQIEQQPQLTFISMGLADGQYYAGSRAPLGADRALHMLRAQIGDGRAMQVLRVDALTRQPELVSRSPPGFDARSRPWYRSALAHDALAWYPPYRYQVGDAQGAYAAIGMGVSAPVRTSDGRLIGVLSADLALSQIDEFLATLAAETGGKAFLAQASGELLASSANDASLPAAAGKGSAQEEPRRTRIDQSRDPVLRALGRQILHGAQAEGQRFIEVDGARHLARWWTHALHRGPALTMAIALPESRFAPLLRGVLRNTVYTTLALLLAALLFALCVAALLLRPLRALSDWAGRLSRADWDARAPRPSPIRELHALAEAMGAMAAHLKAHAQELEQTVAQRTRELENALAALGQTFSEQRQFIAMLSHELRSPLAVIQTAGQVLALRSVDNPAQQALARRILRGAARLGYFFDNCLTQDRIDSADFALAPTPVDLAELALWASESGGQLAQEQPLRLAVEPALPPLQGDPVLLRVLLANLLSNAFKYSAAGAPVSLSVRRAGALCRFAVDDAGPGIAADEQSLVFEKYRRGRSAKDKPGAGLGLALVKRIAELHGGSVRHQALPERGTRFVVEIPFAATTA